MTVKIKIVIGSDHAAYEAKEKLKTFLENNQKFNLEDVGTDSSDRCDYPDYAIQLVKRVSEEDCFGILLCGSGIGVSIVANRFMEIRAALCRTVSEAVLSRQHNDSNVLCLGGRVSSEMEIREMAISWLETKFAGGRHEERLEIFKNLGEKL